MDGPDSSSSLLFTPPSHKLPLLLPPQSPMKQSSERAIGEEEDVLLLSKRPRSCMRQTASMREFAALTEDAPRPSDQAGADRHVLHLLQEHNGGVAGGGRASAGDWIRSGYYVGAVAPRVSRVGRRRNSADFVMAETAHFLRTCGLCKRRLGPGRDTFMYRGDIAFCSLECRQQHMNQEDLKEKYSLTSRKETSPSSNSSEKSDTGGAVSAA